MNKFSCIVLAGGKGKRFGGQKQFANWKGLPLWLHVAMKCAKVSDDVIVVGVDVKAGNTRQESVYNGLQYVKYDVVVIVEAARPCVTSQQIKTIAEYVTDTNPSISYAKKCINTIYYDNKHLYRDECYELLVPQAFKTKTLIFCHRALRNHNMTSDTEMIQTELGISPTLLFINDDNLFKVTFKKDLKLLKFLEVKE